MDQKTQTARKRNSARKRDKDKRLTATTQLFVKESNTSEEEVLFPQTAVTHQKASPQDIFLAPSPVIMDRSTVTTAATTASATSFTVRSGYDGGFLDCRKVTTLIELLSDNHTSLAQHFPT